MEIQVSYYTDKGTIKQINQDSLSIKIANSLHGTVAFAVVCDGMGGLAYGELASKEVVLTFDEWFATELPDVVVKDKISEIAIFEQWQERIDRINEKMQSFADAHKVMMGTTLSALLVYQNRYYICHVGDSRIYRIQSGIEQMTEDQTLVVQEVKMGILTKEEAAADPRRNMLLQCVGASEIVVPQFCTGVVDGNTTFLLCSDGLIHTLSETELCEAFKPECLTDADCITEACKKKVLLAMERGERDNITAIAMSCR